MMKCLRVYAMYRSNEELRMVNGCWYFGASFTLSFILLVHCAIFLSPSGQGTTSLRAGSDNL
ncbi:hypothetical protein B0J17DRAFT_660027 [Rhizoctonia solani]|nr:hypothetical protein B0J17DRAFT_660027 [Rhizoctonia solani]